MIKPGRPRTTVTPQQVKALAEGKAPLTWKQISSELKISTATAMRLYRKYRAPRG